MDKQRKSKPIIFISHASQDRKIIENFINYILNLGLEIKTEDIFSSTTAGTKPPIGMKWRDIIKDRLKNAKVVFMFITTNYKNSEICHNEGGAAWILSKKIIPLIVEPIDYSNVGIIYGESQVEKLTESESLDRVRVELERILEIQPTVSHPSWTRQKNNFLSFLRKYIEKNPFRTREEEYQKTKKELTLLKDENRRLKNKCRRRLVGIGIISVLFLISFLIGLFCLMQNNNTRPFNSLGEKIRIFKNAEIKISEKFEYSTEESDSYWIYFIDYDDYIWPQQEISSNKFNKVYSIPKGFNGGKLILALVSNKTIEDYFSNGKVKRTSKFKIKKIILATKILIK
jgi:hypothetical protein